MSEGRELKKSVALLDVLIQLIQLDEGQYVSSRELAKNLGVSRRTVFRYINDLIYVEGVSIDVDKRKGYRISVGEKLLEKLRSLSRNLYKTILLASVPSPIYSKIQKQIPHDIKNELKMIENIISNEDIISADFEKVSNLIYSTMKRYKVKTKYLSLNDLTVKERTIHPYKLFIRDGQLYCIAFCEMRKDVRTFRVDRFVEVTVTNEVFKIPSNFSAKEYLDKTIHTFVENEKPIKVKAWISDKLKTYLKYSPRMKSQRIYSENGNNFVEFEVLSVMDFMIWAFSWMDDIRVLEPPEVVEEMIETYQRILSMYSPDFLKNKVREW